MMKFGPILLLLVAFIHFSECFLCATKDRDGNVGVVACENSCYAMGFKVGGVEGMEKGCADDKHEDNCAAADFLGLGLVSGHICYCNSILCNASSMPSVFLPLLFIPFLLQKML